MTKTPSFRAFKTLVLFTAVCVLLGSSEQRAQSGPPIRPLTDQDVFDMMVGSSIQGTRSSNSAGMIANAKRLLGEGKKFQIVNFNDIPDGWTIVQAAGGIGGGGAWEYVTERVQKQKLPTVGNTTLLALNALSKHLGKKVDALVRNEAAGATLNVFQTATAAGIPVIDACPAGRAKPEVQQSLTFASGLLITPAALVTRWGDVVIVDKAIDDYRYEDLARSLAVASGGGISNARGVISGSDAKRYLIPGALSEAIVFGRTVREAVEQKKDPVAALVGACQGCVKVFQGIVRKAETKGERGHTYTDAELEGTGAYKGHTYRVYVKNENIVSWLDGKPDVISPDYLYNLDARTGDAVTSKELGGYPVGLEVAMVARPAHAGWRTAKGIEIMGPRHFGFDFDYVPLEQILKTRPRIGQE
jgi:DUF917 family protein